MKSSKVPAIDNIEIAIETKGTLKPFEWATNPARAVRRKWKRGFRGPFLSRSKKCACNTMSGTPDVTAFLVSVKVYR